MPTTRSVLEILDDAAIERLRKGYDRALMHGIVKRTLNVPYPPVTTWTGFIMDELYASDSPLDPAQRELVIISQLCGQGLVAPLATHIYWGLVEGLSPAQIAQCITLAGTYSGAQKYVIGIRVMQQMLTMLADCAAAGEEAAALPSVAQKLLAMFPG
ncbi:MAG: carboxymuconolactone decarboxylase family protein [Myxococcales bacterium]|nr:carboxymuconolactone decarboxylase family protein [Myxococcales bacterium]